MSVQPVDVDSRPEPGRRELDVLVNDPARKTPAHSVSVPATEADPVTSLPGWPSFPPGIELHPSVDAGLDDPSLLDGRRQCVTARQDGERCRTVAVGGELLCPLHSGRLDSAAGGRAKAEKDAARKERAEAELGRRSLGTRAAILHVLTERQADVETVVGNLLTDAAAGDRRAQALLLPYIDQALGKPTETVEHSTPDSEHLTTASTASLAALVAAGRARRLGLVPAPVEHEHEAETG